MTSPLIEINKVLDALLDKETLVKLSEEGEFPQVSFKKKSGDFWFIFFELVHLCGQRIEKALERKLYRSEILFMAGKVEQFLILAIKS